MAKTKGDYAWSIPGQKRELSPNDEKAVAETPSHSNMSSSTRGTESKTTIMCRAPTEATGNQTSLEHLTSAWKILVDTYDRLMPI